MTTLVAAVELTEDTKVRAEIKVGAEFVTLLVELAFAGPRIAGQGIAAAPRERRPGRNIEVAVIGLIVAEAEFTL